MFFEITRAVTYEFPECETPSVHRRTDLAKKCVRKCENLMSFIHILYACVPGKFTRGRKMMAMQNPFKFPPFFVISFYHVIAFHVQVQFLSKTE